ncbi:MAG: tetratricopeptide repeat protein [Pseudomonadota bacterium]
MRTSAGLSVAALSLLLTACAATGPFQTPDQQQQSPTDALAEGHVLLRSGEYDLAYNAFITALRTSNRPAEALTGAGLALEAQGQLTRALEHFRRAAEIAPGSDIAHNNHGVVLYRLGEYAQARQAFRMAFAVSSGRSSAAAANLRATEQALAARATPAPPLSRFSVQRLGSSEYRLVERPPEDTSG